MLMRKELRNEDRKIFEGGIVHRGSTGLQFIVHMRIFSFFS